VDSRGKSAPDAQTARLEAELERTLGVHGLELRRTGLCSAFPAAEKAGKSWLTEDPPHDARRAVGAVCAFGAYLGHLRGSTHLPDWFRTSPGLQKQALTHC